MIVCDLCGRTARCQPRAIEGKEYDICAACWSPLAKKLKGKGRVARRERETVFIPPVTTEPKAPETKPAPGEPPKIWSRVH